jgi:formylglycine-generating enzyme required for sulfatase activity
LSGGENLPVNYVSYFDALRFVNWMNNGKGSGDTETGSYTLLGGTFTPSNSATVTRNAGAVIVLPNDDEWYKAAYYNGSTYFDFPTGTDAQITCAAPNGAGNQANCGYAVGDLTAVGSYTGSASPYGTFDQAGNVAEWNDAVLGDGSKVYRGGDFAELGDFARGGARFAGGPYTAADFIGFRIAMVVPEPTTGLLVIAGLLGFGLHRRICA